MERNVFLNMARYAKVKALTSGAWWSVKWKPDELVIFERIQYIPWRYLMDFDAEGNTLNLAEMHDLKANSVVVCRLEDISQN